MVPVENTPIDITYDMRTDARGKDPDAASATLRHYHQLLWSKPLPDATTFALETNVGKNYLLHRSELGTHSLGSDTIVHTLRSFRGMSSILEQVPAEWIEEMVQVGQTIAGHIVFPGNKIGRKSTINGARGFHPRIRDRWDLTLECIRRHYAGSPSPLSATLDRYQDFFALFESFSGYVEFFLLQDHVSADHSQVLFYLPCEDFQRSALPVSVDEYRQYYQRTMAYITARAERIDRWARIHLE